MFPVPTSHESKWLLKLLQGAMIRRIGVCTVRQLTPFGTTTNLEVVRDPKAQETRLCSETINSTNGLWDLFQKQLQRSKCYA